MHNDNYTLYLNWEILMCEIVKINWFYTQTQSYFPFVTCTFFIVYDNLEYDGGENFLRKNLIIYNGKHETNVITDTFHRKSHDQINSQSVKKKNIQILNKI